jgi:type II restriction enzyme
MDLQCSTTLAACYKSASQVARVLTEKWCARELYCPACDSDRLTETKPNSPVVDFLCVSCEQPFQLKSLKHWNERRIVDAGYEAMIRAIRSDTAPNLLLLQYSGTWLVRNLVLIPKMFFSESIIERRAPLGPNARRAGWVGCNILVGQVPVDGKIFLVRNGVPVGKTNVREEFSRIRGLSEIPPSLRGWTLDVLRVIRRLEKPTFSLNEVYRFESELKVLHPNNQNVRPKIRQQLQVLRDLGLLSFEERGIYRAR